MKGEQLAGWRRRFTAKKLNPGGRHRARHAPALTPRSCTRYGWAAGRRERQGSHPHHPGARTRRGEFRRANHVPRSGEARGGRDEAFAYNVLVEAPDPHTRRTLTRVDRSLSRREEPRRVFRQRSGTKF